MVSLPILGSRVFSHRAAESPLVRGGPLGRLAARRGSTRDAGALPIFVSVALWDQGEDHFCEAFSGFAIFLVQRVVSAVEVLVDFYDDLCLLDFEADTHEIQKQQRNLPLIQRGTPASTRSPLDPQEQMTRLGSYARLVEVAHLLPIPTVELPREQLVAFQPPQGIVRHVSSVEGHLPRVMKLHTDVTTGLDQPSCGDGRLL